MKLQLDAVVKTVNAVTGADLMAQNRIRENVDARCIFYKIARDIFNLSLTKIAKYMGKNHATILHGLKQFENFYPVDKNLRKTYQASVSMLDQHELWEHVVESK